MTAIKDILIPRKEVLEGKFQGVLQSHKVEASGDRLENDPDRLFNATYPSNSLKNIFDGIRNKLSGDSSQGGFVLSGPKGSGKSHGLILLFHMFRNPEKANPWLKSWNIPFRIPAKAECIILSTRKVDPDLLWVPILEKAGRRDLLNQVRRYPTTDHIEKLVGDKTIAIFLDEIETWYGSFDRDEEAELIERNEFFIENLLEVARDPDFKLFVFISSLNTNEELRGVVNRTEPPYEDMSATGDREKIILHRLIQTPRDKVDLGKVRRIAREYVSGYDYPIQIKEQEEYFNQMMLSYPFHPLLLEVLESIYESTPYRQNVRGMMDILSDALRDYYGRTDFLLLSDISEVGLRGINRDLVNKFSSDVRNKEVKDIPYSSEILRTVLIFTLDERSQAATESDVLLGTLKPTAGMTINQISMSLENLYGTAHYLHRDDSNYLIKRTENLMALVEREKRNVEDEEAIDKLSEVIKRDLFENKVFVYGREEVPSDPNVSFVAMLEAYRSDKDLQEELESFLHGRTYQNTVIFITPLTESPIKEKKLLDKSKRIVAGTRLMGRIETERQKLKELVEEESSELVKRLREMYGRWIKWSPEKEPGKVSLIRKQVKAQIGEIKSSIGTDKTHIAEKIMEEVSGKESGVKIEFLLKDFKKFRRLPILLDDEVFYGAIRELYRDGRIVIEGDRSMLHIYPKPIDQIRDEYTIHDPKFIPEDELIPPTEAPEMETVKMGEGIGFREEEMPRVERRAEIVYIDVEGNSPRVLSSNIEARINQKTDYVKGIQLIYVLPGLSKEEIMNFIENLPEKGDKISARLEVERAEAEQ
jgi:hypothetical protein